VIAAVIAGLWLASQTASGELTTGGAVLGAALALIPVAILVGGGLYLIVLGRQQTQQASEMQTQRRLLDIVKSRGQVSVDELALELQTNIDRVRQMTHQLVGLQVFSGYVNWKEGVLYSEDAQHLRNLKQCKNCGGEIELAGKGVVACRFCGTEYFLN
jgi:hypothetical protein